MRQHATVAICRTLYFFTMRLSLIGIKTSQFANIAFVSNSGTMRRPRYISLPMPRHKSLLIDSAMILTLILIGVVGYKLSPLLLPKADVTANPDPACNLQQDTCSAVLPGGHLRFTLTPHPIPLTAPLQMLVELEGIDAKTVVVDFAGVSMNMGFNRPALALLDAGRFTGQALLPVCVTGRMIWQVTVLVETGRTRIAVPFRFEAGH